MSTLRDGIRMPTPGRAPGPSFHREQIEGAQRGQLVSVPGFRIERGAGGTRLHAKESPAALVAPTLVPFRLLDRSTPADGWQLSVWPGTVFVTGGGAGSQTPTLGGDPLTDDPRPVAAVSTAAVKVYLHVETDDDEEFVALTVDLVDAAATQPADDFWHGYLLLGTATKAGDAGAPRLTIAPSTTGDKAYRKVNLTHLWGAL